VRAREREREQESERARERAIVTPKILTLLLLSHVSSHSKTSLWHASHSYVWHASFIYVTCLIHTCDMPHSYMCDMLIHMWHASFIRVTGLIHICDMPHSYMWHASFIYVWHESHSYAWHVSFVCVICILEDWRALCSSRDMRYRVAKTHRIPRLYRSFSAKVTYI